MGFLPIQNETIVLSLQAEEVVQLIRSVTLPPTLVKNEIELRNFLNKNLISDEIIIGMGAGTISKWMKGLKFSL